MNDRLQKILKSKTILTEGSVFERLRREPGVILDADVAHGALVTSADGQRALEAVYKSYIDVAKRLDTPILILSATWRCNEERLKRSRWKDRDLNEENVRFLQSIRKSYGAFSEKILIGGLIGCRGDAYKPEESLSSKEAEDFHRPQIEALANAGVDLLFASTLPATEEGSGIARVMAKTKIPFVLSFVIRPTGTVLDGVHLKDSIARIDSDSSVAPLGYFVNCVHPSLFLKAFSSEQSAQWIKRVIGFQGNTSKKSPEELLVQKELDTDSPESLSIDIDRIHRSFHLPFVGGCCGTNPDHIFAIGRSVVTQ